MTHTATPWRVEENTDLIWGDCNPDDTTTYGMGYPIVSGFASFGNWASGRPDFNEKEANAAFIVTAVNSYDKDQALIKQMAGALQFILAFYEPGQRYLDTNAWTQAEAGGRAAMQAVKDAGYWS